MNNAYCNLYIYNVRALVYDICTGMHTVYVCAYGLHNFEQECAIPDLWDCIESNRI